MQTNMELLIDINMDITSRYRVGAKITSDTPTIWKTSSGYIYELKEHCLQ
jgi:hypothetical protein